ncbi:MAG: AAA family ATPase [Myxococcota bacterium]
MADLPSNTSDSGQRSRSRLTSLREAVGKPIPPGGVGVIVARAGVGKTALLVQLGIEALLTGRPVLHVAHRDTVDHVRAHYDEILRALRVGGSAFGEGHADAAVRVERGRMIHSFHGREFQIDLVARNLEVLAEAAQFVPQLILVDGFDEIAPLTAALDALRAVSTNHQAELWVTTHSESADAPAPIPGLPLRDGDRVVRLVPQGRVVKLVTGPDEAGLALDPATMLVASTEPGGSASDSAGPPIAARDCTLYSGGAAGAEAAFGEAAERWGVHEVNLTFDGHLQARTRGRYVLSPNELALGDVSLGYVSKRLSRTYNDQGGLIRGVLQTLWHMVSRSQQVFVVGRIQSDGTVVGGTGWSVELARMWSRDLWVYDQDQGDWFRWDGDGWVQGMPRITAPHVCGTGTRYLDPVGKAAIDALFTRSFG